MEKPPPVIQETAFRSVFSFLYQNLMKSQRISFITAILLIYQPAMKGSANDTNPVTSIVTASRPVLIPIR